MRIALFTETFLPKIDGVVNTLCRLLTHLENDGHTCLLFAPSGAPPRFGQTPVVRLPGSTLPFYQELKLVFPVLPAMRFLRPFQPDLIHLVNPFALGPVGLWAGRRLGVPVVSSFHTDLPGFIEKWGYRQTARWVAAYLRMIHNLTATTLCPSHATRRALEERGFLRVGVWSRGVDRERFHPDRATSKMRARLSGGQIDKPLLLYVGRLSKEKRVDLLAETVRAVPNVRLGIVGDGPHREALVRQMAGDPVVFTGYLTGDALAEAYASADVFVFPSENDTFGNVVLEAMASGLPVIAARAGGPVDMVRSGENGMLFAPGDAGDLVRCVQRMVRAEDVRKHLREGALREAGRRSWSAVMAGLVETYREVLHASEAQAEATYGVRA